MSEFGIISADSHIVEPADMWASIDKRYRDRAPRATVERDGTVAWFVDGDTPLGSVGAPSQAGLRYDDPLKITFQASWEDVRPGCNNPAPRLKDMARDGVEGEVVYPTLGARLYGVAGGDLLSAIFRAGNDWLAAFCAAEPRRFRGLALLHVDDVPTAVAELERAVKTGLAGAMIPTYPGEERPYDDPAYDRLWAAAQALDVPVALHVASCRPGPGQLSIFTRSGTQRGSAGYSSTQDYWMRRSVANMIFAGVFERFPRLKVAIVEHELAWAPYFLRQMDFHYKELSQTAPNRFKGATLPSDFFRANIYVSFQEDKLGVDALPAMIGTDTLMWGSDYPHAESTWPNSRKVLDELLAGVSAAHRRKLTRDNVARLFKFD
ncbi:MAG: amidohydrolase family protein [Alphaproteobacteria bacterium]